MQLCIKNTKILKGDIIIPGSKSQSIRALMIALLSKGETQIENCLDSDDVQHAKKLCHNLGAEARAHSIKSPGLPLKANTLNLNSGNSGISTCFILPILGLRENTDQEIILDCFEQMRKRPIKSLINALKNLGMNIDNETLPIKINGKLLGGKTEVDGFNSQYLSALLLALPCAPNDSEIRVKNLQERPYVELTLAWLRKHNIEYVHQKKTGLDVYSIKGGQQYQARSAVISGDYSSASYAIAAAALLPGEVIIRGLAADDPQGDKKLIDILKSMGADIEIQENHLIIRGGKPLTGLRIDANDIPDLLPTLAVLGTYAQGKTEIINVAHARIKEADRIKSMSEGLRKLGAKIEEHEDGLTIYQSKLKGVLVDGFDDHRTVMALSIAGLLASGVTVVTTAEAINKTYPGYVQDMQKMAAQMELRDE